MTGHHDFQLADDVIHKVHVGHYTFYSVAIVKNDKLLIKARGVYATKYLGGEDIGDVTDVDPRTGGETWAAYAEGENKEGSKTLFSEDGDKVGKVLVQGTHYIAGTKTAFVNPYGFGRYTYQGCKHGREGKGEPLRVEQTTEDMKRLGMMP
jgi:hypothetical protein